MGKFKQVYQQFIEQVNNFIPTIKNAFFYFGGSIIQLFISLITSPIFARNLTAEEFGIIGYFTSLKQFVLPVTTLSLTFYYLFKYFKQNESSNKKLFATILVFLTLSNIVVSLISYGLLYTYFVIGNVTIPFYPFALIMILTLFIEVYKTFLLIDLKLKKAAFIYFLYSGILAVLSIGISLLFVVVFQWGAVGRMLGALIALSIVSLLFLKHFNLSINLKLDFKLIKEGLWWSFPMIISAYFYLPMANIDRLLLTSLKDTSELGYYSIGLNIAGYIGTASMALFSAFQPDFYKYIAQRNKSKFLLYALVYFIILSIITILFFLLSETIVGYLTSGRYTRAYEYANYFAVSIFIMSLSKITNSILIALGKSRSQLYINVIVGVIGFLLYKHFINHYGFLGANYGRIAIASLYLLTQSIYILSIKYISPQSVIK